MKVGIIGAGAWGTGIAYTVSRGLNQAILWSFDGEYMHFDKPELPHDVKVTKNMSDLETCDVWVAVTPAVFFRETMIKTKEFYKKQPIIICTKGAEPGTGKFMTEVLYETLHPSKGRVGVLSGPQFASEVAKGVTTGSTLAGSKIIHQFGERVFNQFYLSLTNDVIGTEICGVGKNAVSVISGYVKVNGGGENESAFFMTMAWNEVVRLGKKLGAKEKTFLDFCGVGDLLLTATSTTSRNFSAGVAIANGEKPVGTVEGLSALAALVMKADRAHVSVPLLAEMHKEFSK